MRIRTIQFREVLQAKRIIISRIRISPSLNQNSLSLNFDVRRFFKMKFKFEFNISISKLNFNNITHSDSGSASLTQQ